MAKAYGNLESGSTELTIDRLYKIAEILEVSINTILGFDEKLLFQSCEQNQCNIGVNQKIENTAFIEYLQKEIEWLRAGLVQCKN